MSRNDKILAISFLGSLAALVAIALIHLLLRSTGTPISNAGGSLQDWIEPIAATVTAIGTLALGYLTVVLARETKRLADVGDQPNVVVTFEPNNHLISHLDMHVENTGTATAYDIRVSFDPRLAIADRDPTRALPLSIISILKPKQSISSSLADWADLRTKTFTVHTSWLRRPSSSLRETLDYLVDLNGLEGMTRLGGDPAIEGARAVKKIADTLDSFGSGFKKLAVNTFSSSDRAEEQRLMEERHGRNSRRTASPPGPPPTDPQDSET